MTWSQRAARALLRAVLPAELRDAVIGDLDDEMAERMARGSTPRQASAWYARQALGSLPSAARLRARERRSHRRMCSIRRAPMQSLWQDVHYALRMLRRSPLFTVAAIGTLGLGIGATTAIFSVVHAVFLRELPFREPGRIVRIYESFGGSFTRGVANPANFDYWERHGSSFSHIAGMRTQSATLTGAGDAERIAVTAVMPAFFEVMGVSPAIGRPFTAGDVDGEAPPILLSHQLWTSRYGADPAITARTIILNGAARPVAGVMPASFDYPYEPDAWEPMVLSAADRLNGTAWYLGAVARLKPGITVEQAQTEMSALAEQLRIAAPKRQKNRGASVIALREDLVFRVTDGLTLLQGAVLLVLLIAVVNVANLLLARGTARQREFSVRAAVGATRTRVLRQVLTESLLLGLTGAAVGVILAFWGIRALVALSPLVLPDAMSPSMNIPVLIFALLSGIVTSVLFGLAPAVFAMRTDLAGPAKEGSYMTTSGGMRRRFRAALVVAQVAVAVTLLAAAGLLIRSFTKLVAQDVGFRADRLLTAQTTLPAAKYDTPDKRRQFWRDLFERLENMPGVASVGGSTALPFSNWEWQTDFRILGREDVPNDGTGIRTVHPGYFATLDIPLLSGRTFNEGDGPSSEGAVVVNEAFAKRHLADLEPVGQRIRFTRTPGEKPVVIVGVVGNTRHFRLEQEPGPEVYRPLAQGPPLTLVMAIRTTGDPTGAVSLVRSAIRELDADLPVQQLTTMAALIGRTVSDRRFYVALMSTFSAAALILAVVGIYGVMAQSVGQRTREIGIRMALGAAPGQVERMVLRSGALLIGLGLVLGLGGALAATRLLQTQLFGVTPRDPVTILVVSACLGVLGLGAAYGPAHRARRLDPVAALRRD